MDLDSPVICSRPADGVGLITFNRERQLNALNLAVKTAVVAAIEELAGDDAIRAIVLTGSEKAFVAGTDLREMRDMQPADHAALGTNRMFEVMRACPVPLIAAVEGYALGGGCETVLACDVVFASETARFALPEIKVGIMPGAGGTQLLSRMAGRYRAMKLMLTGEHFGVDDAAAMGLVSQVTGAGAALPAALDFAGIVAQMPVASVRSIKQAVRLGADLPLSEALIEERKLFVALFGSADQKEGMSAFLEKRPAAFNQA